jgi:hypothetical protein
VRIYRDSSKGRQTVQGLGTEGARWKGERGQIGPGLNKPLLSSWPFPVRGQVSPQGDKFLEGAWVSIRFGPQARTASAGTHREEARTAFVPLVSLGVDRGSGCDVGRLGPASSLASSHDGFKCASHGRVAFARSSFPVETDELIGYGKLATVT